MIRDFFIPSPQNIIINILEQGPLTYGRRYVSVVRRIVGAVCLRRQYDQNDRHRLNSLHLVEGVNYPLDFVCASSGSLRSYFGAASLLRCLQIANTKTVIFAHEWAISVAVNIDTSFYGNITVRIHTILYCSMFVNRKLDFFTNQTYNLDMKNVLPKVIFIVGPTASGKTATSIFLAKKFNGEIVNADSRQVYKEMDIATAKPIRDFDKQLMGEFISDGVVHHLMDFVKPNERFTLSDYKEKANIAIADILSRGKLPIVVGGTGLYIWSLVDNLDIPKVEPNSKLRKGFDSKTLDELIKLLSNIDPETVKKIDLKNRRRVLRALEVAISSGESFVAQTTKSNPLYNSLQIGLKCNREKLYKIINNRIDQQMLSGLLEETNKLSKKYPWDLPSMSSIGYKQIGNFLRNEATIEEAVELFKRDTRRYAKRQETWFKRDKRIVWISPEDVVEAQKMVTKFLDK